MGPQEAWTQTDPSLNDLEPRRERTIYVPAPAPPAKIQYIDLTVERVKLWLRRMRMTLQPVSEHRVEILHQLQQRMVNRTGQDMFQSPSFVMTAFPQEAARLLMSEFDITRDDKTQTCWETNVPETLNTILGAGLNKVHKRCWGQSKLLGISALVPRASVVATLIAPLRISHARRSNGRRLLYVTAQYVLMDHTGELHMPKTKARQTLMLSAEEEARVRDIIIRDLQGAASAELSLSSGFLRMLGAQWAAQAAQVAVLEEAEQEAAASAAEVAGLSAQQVDALEHGENWGDADEWEAAYGSGDDAPVAYGSGDEEGGAHVISID